MLNPIERLCQLSKQSSRRIIGLMSGTSLDGVDLALVEIEGAGPGCRAELRKFTTVPYASTLKSQMQSQMQPDQSSVDRICELHISLGRFFAQIIQQTLEAWGETSQSIDCIASHGQTLYHLPEGADWMGKPLHATLQIGDGDQIATHTGILTISDFRTKDIAVGGEGAPLVPYVDYLLFSKPGVARILHNLGGISNLTYLPASGNPQDVIAFDTGPANVLINLAVAALIDPEQHFDPEGQIAAQGQVHDELLNLLLDDPFFKLPPPKSTGREAFGTEYFNKVHQQALSRGMSSEDTIATLTALTAHSIQQAYEAFLPMDQPTEIYFSGGGTHNQNLMQQIQHLLPHWAIRNVQDLRISPDAKEAISFAILANEALAGNPVTLPGVTGSLYRTSLGKISLP